MVREERPWCGRSVHGVDGASTAVRPCMRERASVVRGGAFRSVRNEIDDKNSFALHIFYL
jgi:hypothetical protein